MASDWEIVKLSDFVDIKTGFPFKSKHYLEHGEGYKLLRGDNVVQGAFRWANVKLWSKDELTEKQKGYFLEEGDVILAMDRPWIEAGLKTAQITNKDLPCLLVQRVARLQAKNSEDQDFLRYLVSSYWFVEYLKLVQTGTAIPHISTKQILSYETKIPPLIERKNIGRLLRSLDDKIELNHQMNETLEAMAQVLFKSWFVDFDPVIDNALAAGNAIPDELLERAEQRKAIEKKDSSDIQALFPDEFEFTEEMGWIPKGWSISTLDNLTTELRRGISPKYTEVDGVRVVNQRCIRNHSIDYSVCRLNDASIRKVEGRYLEVGDVLVNSTGVGTLGRMAQVSYLDEPAVVDSHVTVVRPNTELVKPYTFGRLMLSIEPLVESMGLGSTGQTELSRVHLGELVVCIPHIEFQEFIEKSFSSYSNKSAFNLQQNITLAKLRDTLLPQLMSGELRISDAAALVDEVL